MIPEGLLAHVGRKPAYHAQRRFLKILQGVSGLGIYGYYPPNSENQMEKKIETGNLKAYCEKSQASVKSGNFSEVPSMNPEHPHMVPPQAIHDSITGPHTLRKSSRSCTWTPAGSRDNLELFHLLDGFPENVISSYKLPVYSWVS